uniref:Uncharacterized protein n=1 Tax=Anguilla anguilla TaxID=7936 RepID=A0A0E9XFR3_ANGAN
MIFCAFCLLRRSPVGPRTCQGLAFAYNLMPRTARGYSLLWGSLQKCAPYQTPQRKTSGSLCC